MKRDRHSKIEVICEICSNPFMARIERVNQGLGRFCSKECFDIEQNNRRKPFYGRKDLATKYKVGNRYTARWYDENGNTVSESYYRWWWEMNVGEIPDGMVILLKDGNGLNLDPSNFELGTKNDVAIKVSKLRQKDPNYKGNVKRWGELRRGFHLSEKVKNELSSICRNNWKLGKYDNSHVGENNPYWKNKKQRHPKEFDKHLKQFIRERDKYICQICGKENLAGRGGNVHHIDGIKTNNSSENLILLCLSCHAKVHFSGQSSPVIMAFHSKLLE